MNRANSATGKKEYVDEDIFAHVKGHVMGKATKNLHFSNTNTKEKNRDGSDLRSY